MSELCNEIITDIILWLSVSDIVNCRRICRKWRAATGRERVRKMIMTTEENVCVGGVISDRKVARLRCQLKEMRDVPVSLCIIFWHLAKRYRASKLAANSRRIVEDGWYRNTVLPSYLTANGIPDAATATLPVFEQKLSVIFLSMNELIKTAQRSTTSAG